jgi:carboxypeptidase D
MLFVENPVGVGYSQGTPNITNEVELGTFELKGHKTYLTGESYAGFYVPYIADSFIEANDLEYFNLAGISINDPIIGDETIQQQVVILPFVEYWQNLLYLNETFMEDVRERQKQCNYSSYLDEYFQFPPPQKAFPVLPDPYSTEQGTCDMFDTFYNAILEVNPSFNIYFVTESGCVLPFKQCFDV